MRLSFVGDICLGRHIREKYESTEWSFISTGVIEKLKESGGKVIANLESPVSQAFENQDTLFCGNPTLLEQFKWVDCFSLANNHINDFGEEAIKSTIDSLNDFNIAYNGIFVDNYQPYILEDDNSKVAIMCCAPRVGEPFESDSRYHLLLNKDPLLYNTIKNFKSKGYLVLVFTHMGSMFCSYPNPMVMESIQKIVEAGCDAIFVSHPHCIGGIYNYQGVPVFYSLGDFLMDGASFRRRQSYSVSLNISNNKINTWEIVPTITSKDLRVVFPTQRKASKMLKGISKVSSNMTKKLANYDKFYKRQYKRDLIKHSLSSLSFLYSTEGLRGLIKIVFSRMKDFKGVLIRLKKGSSKVMMEKETESGHVNLRSLKT